MEQPQVHTSHYKFEKYATEERFVSYYYQLKEVLRSNPSSIVEVGVGDKVFGSFVRNTTDITYRSVDIDPDLEPDIVGSVTKLPLENDSVDVACAFEVLEHLPYTEFEKAIAELARIARTYVVISLPHFGPMLSFSFKIPFFRQVQLAIKIPFPKKHLFNGEHYWEVGKAGYPASRIRSVLRTQGFIVRDFVPFNSVYHHFFVLDVSKKFS